MRRLTALLLSLLLVLSLGLGSAAHAYEGRDAGALSAATATALGHHPGDGDEVPADSDKDYPHHHTSCHGDHLGVPAVASTVPQKVDRWSAGPRPVQLAPAGMGSNPDLRPPIA